MGIKCEISEYTSPQVSTWSWSCVVAISTHAEEVVRLLPRDRRSQRHIFSVIAQRVNEAKIESLPCSDAYEPGAMMLGEEAQVIAGLLVGLNVIDCNMGIKDEDLDQPVSVKPQMYFKN